VTIVSINQPAYLPWLGYFQRIAASDLHIVLDHVQFEKNSFTNRNRILTAAGPAWLSVPVRTGGKFGDLSIAQLEIDNSRDWRRKHWGTIRHVYGRTPYFSEHADFFEGVYNRSWSRVADLCRVVTDYLLHAFGIQTPLRFSSSMSPRGQKSDLVLHLCRQVDASVYLSGPFGRDYLVERVFEEQGIEVRYQDYRHPEYPQRQTAGQRFEPFMAAIDLLFNCGPESKAVLCSGQCSDAACVS
jgi:WbqC-like protein